VRFPPASATKALNSKGRSSEDVTIRCSDGTVVRLAAKPDSYDVGEAVTGTLKPDGIDFFGSHDQLMEEAAFERARHIVCPRCGSRVRPENATRLGNGHIHCRNCGLDFPPTDGQAS